MKKMIRSLIRSVIHILCSSSVLSGMIRVVTQAGVVPKRIWKYLPVERAFSVSVAPNHTFIYESIRYDAIGRALHWKGIDGFEPETTRLFVQLVNESRTFVDVGANSGLFSLLACATNPATRVVSFEPLPLGRERLKSNIRMNGWEQRCMVRAEAVSSKTGTTEFHIPEGRFPTSASLNPEGFKGYKGRTIQCDMIQLDTLLETHPDIDLIKIDVEGFEDTVLEGMPTILSTQRPVLIIECLPDGPYATIETFLASSNYRFYHIRNEGLLELEHIEPDETEVYKNFLFVPNEKQISALTQ